MQFAAFPPFPQCLFQWKINPSTCLVRFDVACQHGFNSLPNDIFLGCLTLKAFADNEINVHENFKFILGRVENIVGKGEKAGDQHFLLFPQCFLKASFSRLLKVGIVL